MLQSLGRYASAMQVYASAMQVYANAMQNDAKERKGKESKEKIYIRILFDVYRSQFNFRKGLLLDTFRVYLLLGAEIEMGVGCIGAGG